MKQEAPGLLSIAFIVSKIIRLRNTCIIKTREATEGYPYKNMKLKINGTDTDIQDGLTVAGLLESLKIDPGRVAVEVNLKIVKKCDYASHLLNDMDAVEIVNFVGGG